MLYDRLGDFEKGLRFSLEGIHAAPDSNYGYLNAAYAYTVLGRFEEAKAIANAGLQKTDGALVLHAQLSLTAMAQGDASTEQREAALSTGDHPDFVRFVLFPQALKATGNGQLHKAQELLSQAEDISRRLGLSELQALALCEKPLMDSLLGGKNQKKYDGAGPLSLSQSPDVVAAVAMTQALSGNDSAALRLADDLSRKRPQDTWFKALHVPAIRAQIEINHGNVAKAIELLRSAESHDKAEPGILSLRGRAYLLNHQPQEAEKEFQAAMKLKAVAFRDPSPWLARLYLARAYAMEGDTAKTRAAYQDFLVMWKDADADIPLLTAAKSEYAKLH